MTFGSRTKGQVGERDAIAKLTLWATPVLAVAGGVVELKRNLMQTREGGYDIVGLDWLALEVKRQEVLSLPAWWRQTLAQARPGQVPLLMYRQNRSPWRFRVKLPAAHCGLIVDYGLVADLDEENARSWFQHELWYRTKKGVDIRVEGD